jgi:hypothetical protein
VTASVQVLAGAGWRVKVVPDAARLAVAWQELYRGGEDSAGVAAGAPTVASTVEASNG